MSATIVFPNDLEVILDSTATKDEWLLARKLGVGGSEVTKLVGASKYGGAIDIYEEKVNGVEPEFTPEQIERMESGLRMENAILEWGAEKLGMNVEHDSLPALVGCRYYLRRLASMDGVGTIDGKPVAILEAKNVGHYITDSYLIETYRDQVLWYEGITGIHHGYIVALRGGQELIPIPVEWDEERYNHLGETADRFYSGFVLPRKRPTFDDFPPHVSVIGDTYEGDPNADYPSFEGEEGTEVVELARQHRDLKKRARELKSAIGEVEGALKLKLGDAERMYVGGKVVANWGVVHSSKVDRDVLGDKHPEVLEEVTVDSTYRRFTVPASGIPTSEVT